MSGLIYKKKKRLVILIKPEITEIGEIKEIAKARLKIDSGYDGYVNQTDLGSKFQLKISSTKVGWLLRMAGIAMVKESSTIPFDKRVPKFAKVKIYIDCFGREAESYVWNWEECIKKIENWLQIHNLLNEFYTCNTNGKLDKFLKNTYQDFKNKKFDN